MNNNNFVNTNDIKQYLSDIFKDRYYMLQTNANNIDKFANNINKYLQSLKNSGLLYEAELEPVEIETNKDQVIINVAKCFKNYPKKIQEKIYCDMANLNVNEVEEFNYNKDGYIEGIKLKQKLETIEFTVKVQ